MAGNPDWKSYPDRAADIVRDAGGRIVGRTRLQKIAYLLELADVGEGFAFANRHYRPYSEDLAYATRDAALLDCLREEERPASWGGVYSIFTTDRVPDETVPEARSALAHAAADADPIELELAATAAFLSAQGENDPWEETARRKPEKAKGGRLENAKGLYERLRRPGTPGRLPEIR